MTQQPLQQLSDPRSYEQDRIFAGNNPSAFWDQVATKYIHWDKKYESIYNQENLKYPEWFKGGLLNTCYNVLDLNVKNPLKKDKYAIIYECPYLNETISLTYGQLLEKVFVFSRVLLNLNISKGDIVIIHLPNLIQSIIAMLSCSRIGAVICTLHECFNVVGFTEKVNLLKPKLIISSNYGIHNEKSVSYLSVLKKVLESSNHKPESVLLYKRNDVVVDEAAIKDQFTENDFSNLFDWDVQFLKSKSNPYHEYIPVESNHPLYIVFSSGTSNGDPKPSIKTNGPDLVGMSYIASSSLNTNNGSIMLSLSLIGFESFQASIYSTLLGGNTLVFQEGIDSPQTFLKHGWKLVEKNKISKFRIPIKIIKQMIKLDKDGKEAKKYDLSSLDFISLSDDVCDQSIIDYIEKKIGVLCIVLYGQSQFVYFTLSSGVKNDKNNLKKYGKPPSFIKVSILSEAGKEITKDGETGELCLKTPLPPGFAISYYNDNKGFEKLFQKYPGYLNTGDIAIKENGRYGIISRVDDLILINGLPKPIALSKIDSSIFKHDKIIDCCSIYLKNENNLIGILVLKDNGCVSSSCEQLKNEINTMLANDISPKLQVNSILIISSLPRTSSGKLVRNMITNLLYDKDFMIPKSFSDVNLLNEILFNFKQQQ